MHLVVLIKRKEDADLTYTKNNILWTRVHPIPSFKNLELAPRQYERNEISNRF